MLGMETFDILKTKMKSLRDPHPSLFTKGHPSDVSSGSFCRVEVFFIPRFWETHRPKRFIVSSSPHQHKGKFAVSKMNPTKIENQELPKTLEKQTEIEEEKLDRLIEAGSNPARSTTSNASSAVSPLNLADEMLSQSLTFLFLDSCSRTSRKAYN
jgi:hypothetical protein